MAKYRTFQHISQSLSTLAAKTSIKSDTTIDGSNAQGVRLRKIRYAVTHIGGTATEGPFLYGLCSKALTVAELDEAIDADPSFDGDVPAEDRTQRKVVVLGSIGQSAGNESGVVPWRTARWYWVTPENDGIQFFVRNQDTSPLMTGMVVKFMGQFYGEWLHD